MNYVDLVAALGDEMQLDLSEAAHSGSCMIRFDDKIDVAIESDDDGRVVQLHAALGVVDATAQTTLFPALLQIHMFGMATDSAYFGFDPESQRVTFFKSQPLASLGGIAAVRAVESFVNQCVRWIDALPSLSAVELSDEPALPNFSRG